GQATTAPRPTPSIPTGSSPPRSPCRCHGCPVEIAGRRQGSAVRSSLRFGAPDTPLPMHHSAIRRLVLPLALLLTAGVASTLASHRPPAHAPPPAPAHPPP